MDSRLPAFFVPHGAPTFALRPGAAGAALRALADEVPAPRAVVIASAHWDTEVPEVGLADRPATVHDFGGFDDELYTLRYPATGCPAGAREVMAALEAAGLPARAAPDQGLDHGAWVPLRHMYPDADVPVIPVSIQHRAGPAGAYRLGQALAPLAARGFLVVGSGNLTHNLRDYMVAARTGGRTPPYVRAFADWVAERAAGGDVTALLDYRRRAPGAVQAHPTDEHLLPFFVALGAGGQGGAARRVHAGVDDYVLAMDAFAFGAGRPA